MATRTEVRQDCPHSSLLFGILIIDMKTDLGEETVKGIKLDGERVRLLEYADDIVYIILAEEEEGMRWLLKKLGNKIEGKIVKGKEIEEVKEVTYLGLKLR